MIIVRLERLLAAAAAAAGLLAWVVFFADGLTLTHYDARAHLVVARRVIDNLTPGWQQIGAVWLPLPHLINLLPAQVDALYRTGAFASLVSVASLALAAWAMARLVLLVTGSSAGAVAATLLLVLNANLLYLHATPMTEPLLLASVLLVVLWLYEWTNAGGGAVPRRLGWALLAAAWTRYEAWPVICAAVGAALFALWRSGMSAPLLARRAWPLVGWPAAAIALFLVNSRITTGSWLVTAGFYVPDPHYAGQLWRTVVGIWWGTHQLSSYIVELAGLAGATWVAGRAFTSRAHAAQLIPVALFAAAALPLYAFYSGHPYRIRYMVPVVVSCTLFAGVAAGALGRLRPPLGPLAAAALVSSLLTASPLRHIERAPFVAEAQWDVPASLNRRAVTACLADYGGEKVLASMGSLAHYMHELAGAGFDLADFIHEGNGVIWELALETGPALHAGWMLVEEAAEGGDVLARRVRADTGFTRGMTRVCEGGGVALYRRN
ncbi:MAG TPA: hypothetical protein VNI78_04980 [Vicinamibacterales bacterium]|nr:hypothetical protein [Vicinamibacterales bacterium]